ncbi:DUF1403 family protein [Mesorhizobium sp. A623]
MLASMIRAVPSPIASPPTPRVPAWALPVGSVSNDVDAAFCAGAALTSLDNLVRSDPVWAGCWRQRLALKSAAGACRLAGRSEDEAALRDAWHLRAAGDNAGPAGAIYGAWRQLASRQTPLDAGKMAEIVDWLGLRWDDTFASIPSEIGALVGAGRSAPFAAAAIADQIVALSSGAEALAWWCADLALAQSLRWPKPVPLLMAQVFSPVFRIDGSRGRIKPGEEGFERAVCLALAQGAAEACRLAGEIDRRAQQIMAVAPKLRAKGAGEVIQKLLDDDAVPSSLTTRNLSRFGSRRLFERLQKFEAVRELSGRSTFRLFGL